MRISEDGNVGIGTITPTEKLHVLNASGFSALFDRGIKDGSVSGFSHFFSPGNAHIFGRAVVLESSLQFPSPVTPSTSNGYRIRNINESLFFERVSSGTTQKGDVLVLNGDNVGIGTNDPQSTLDVN